MCCGDRLNPQPIAAVRNWPRLNLLRMQFTEHQDRFEASAKIGDHDVTISADKPISTQDLLSFAEKVQSHGHSLIESSLAYFNENKAHYGCDYIDDLSDPQIIGSSDGPLGVWWCSEKGEARGDAIIGVDFSEDGLEPIQLTLGD